MKLIIFMALFSLETFALACSFSVQTPTVHTNHLKKSSLMSSLQSCRTTLRPDLLIRKHPVITLCVGLGFCAYGLATYGLIKCYSGHPQNKNGKNSNNTDSQKTVFERFKTMNTINKIKMLLCPLLFMYSFIQPQVWTEFVNALDHITAHEQIEKKIEEKKEPKKLEEEKKEKEPKKLEEKKLEEEKKEEIPWSIQVLRDAVYSVEVSEDLKKIWAEKINNKTTKQQFKDIDKQFRKDVLEEEGETSLLCIAAQHLSLDFVQQLLDLGADASEIIRYDDEEKEIRITPLYAALLNTTNDKLEIAKVLLMKGATQTINAQIGPEDFAALHKAVIQGNDNLEVIKLLIDNGAQIDIKTKWKETPLHYAAKALNNEDICRYLLESGADPSLLDDSGNTPFELANFESYEEWHEYLYPDVEKTAKILKKQER